MVQDVRSVLVGLTKQSGENEPSSALAYSLSLAQQAGAHLTVQAASLKLILIGGWVSAHAQELVTAENLRLQTLAEAAAESARSEAASAGVVCTTETPQLTYPSLLESFTAQARVHDFTILDSEPEILAPDRGIIERLLLASGRPLMIVPAGQSTFRNRRIVLAWDGSSGAARATGDALPFLRSAEAVEIVSVEGEKELPDNVTAADLAPHLTRHGVRATVKSVPAIRGDVAETLRWEARASGADMIVMGGFVHSRLREMVFGGVTQALLGSSPVPLFMSH